MHFQALSIGALVPTHHFNGTVHSVFHQACNLRLDSHALLTLLLSNQANLPNGIRIDAASQPSFLNLIRVGQPVACRGGILRIGEAGFSIDLRTARSWRIDLKGVSIDLSQPSQARAWAVAWSELNRSARKSGLSRTIIDLYSCSRQPLGDSAALECFMPSSGHAVPALLQATRNVQADTAKTSLRPLIGLGPGLTPSGDDFLVGYLAGLWSTTDNSPLRDTILAALDRELSETARTTTDISCTYLRSAAQGHVSEPMAKLARRLKHANDIASVRTAAQVALQVGHTSGTDGVLGLLLGCLPWQRHASHLVFGDLLDGSVDMSAILCS
ncbi:MAG: DUF2877 domain-containing protein [Nitrospira sp.]